MLRFHAFANVARDIEIFAVVTENIDLFGGWGVAGLADQ
jgi:hypothetical protein